jgi:hypothetical protein
MDKCTVCCSNKTRNISLLLYYHCKIDGISHLRTGLLLLTLPKGQESNVGDLDGLELDSGNITNGVTLATETGNKDFVVDFDEVETAVVGDESSDLLAVLQQLDTDTLTDGRVGLLRLNTTIKTDD